MNERIRELAKQFAIDFLNKSGYDMREYEPFLEETEKFAALIVKECVNSIPLDMEHVEYLRVMRAVKNTFRS